MVPGSGLGLDAGFPDLIEGSFDEVFPLVAEAVDGAHGLDDAGSGSGEGELTVFHFALVEGKGSVTKDDKPAVGEFAGNVFVEIKDDFFFGELGIADFHEFFCGLDGIS